MPELPEVETIVRSLQVNVGARIKTIDIRRQDIIRLQQFPADELNNRIIKDIKRRGKFFVFYLGCNHNLVFHLGMSGRFYMIRNYNEPSQKHIHALIYLNNGNMLVYQDPRRFGGIWLIQDLKLFFNNMGPEPLSNEFTVAYLQKVLEHRQAPVKNILLNQHLISGIGNIYADEALFAAGIRPDRPASSLDQSEIIKLHRFIRNILYQGIEYRGTTFRDYRDPFNQKGNFQKHLKVYGRQNQPCLQCHQTIQQIRIGGRSTHFCNNCQH